MLSSKGIHACEQTDVHRGRFTEAPLHRGSFLSSINQKNFTRIRPFIGIRDQAGAHRILPQIVPLLRVAFIVSNHVIKEPALPDWLTDLLLPQFAPEAEL